MTSEVAKAISDRYAEITGLEDASLSDFVGEVVSDEMPTTGMMTTNNATLNQIYQNAWWGILSNYKGLPVDSGTANK